MYYIYRSIHLTTLKAHLEQIDTGADSSIKVKTYIQSLIDVPLHYHPQHEIVYIQNGDGRLFIADIEENFTKNELFFICGNVPHLFQDRWFSTGNASRSKVAVIQYADSLFDHFHVLPEFDTIRRFEKSINYGIKMRATNRMKLLVQRIEHAQGVFRFNYLTELLYDIITHGDYNLLASVSGNSASNHISYIRLQKINSFISEYSYRDISIEEVASVIHLNKTSLCRFLKRETGKTFSEHLNFYRISHAAKMLRETDDQVMEICYATGFNNPAYFFRQFKKHKGTSPLGYREKHRLG